MIGFVFSPYIAFAIMAWAGCKYKCYWLVFTAVLFAMTYPKLGLVILLWGNN